MDYFTSYMNSKKNKNKYNDIQNRYIQNVSLQHNISIMEELLLEYNSFNEDIKYNDTVSQFMESTIKCIKIINDKLNKN